MAPVSPEEHNAWDATTESGQPPDSIVTPAPGALPSRLSESEINALSGDYELVEFVAQGAMGFVYRARHKLLEQDRAIKVCRVAAQVERFHREAKLLAEVQSPHVVTVHDFKLLGEHRALLVMDWIDGLDLDHIAPQQVIEAMRGRKWRAAP